MKHVDLFSGIGGFSIGFERAGIETSVFCEKENTANRFSQNTGRKFQSVQTFTIFLTGGRTIG